MFKTQASRFAKMASVTACASALLGCVIPQSLQSTSTNEAELGPQVKKDSPPPTAKRGLFGLSDANTNAAREDRSFFSGSQGNSTNNGLQSNVARGAWLSPVSPNVWRSTQPASRVFAVASRVITQSYILSRVDRRNMTLQTDWDKFFIDGRLFRNRIHVSVFPVGPKQTEVVIRNSLEYFSGVSESVADTGSEGHWLPSPDITNEVANLVKNTRIQLQNTARRGD